MKFSIYADKSAATAMYPDIGNNACYPALGLMGEAGEVAEHVKKMLRDDGGNLTEKRGAALVKELGDVLWYVRTFGAEIGTDLAAIARAESTEEFSTKLAIDPFAVDPARQVFDLGACVGSVCGLLYHRNGITLTQGDREHLRRGPLFGMLNAIESIATWAGSSLSEVAEVNIAKLADRQARGVIGGGGSAR